MTLLFHMDTVIAAFTNRGIALASRLAKYFDARVFVPERFSREGVYVITPSLSEWMCRVFHEVSALVFDYLDT